MVGPYGAGVKLIGLGGGIGSGKSTVSAYLAARGAVIVDADLIARQVVEPGTPTLQALVDRFGSGILDGSGALNRPALAAVAFADPELLKALNAITHPAIGVEIARQIAVHQEGDAVVVLDAALLFDSARQSMVGKIAVDVDPEIAVERLVANRGFTPPDAWARINAQMLRDDRRAKAEEPRLSRAPGWPRKVQATKSTAGSAIRAAKACSSQTMPLSQDPSMRGPCRSSRARAKRQVRACPSVSWSTLTKVVSGPKASVSAVTSAPPPRCSWRVGTMTTLNGVLKCTKYC